MRFHILFCLFASVLYAGATADKRQIAGTTITNSDGNTIVNSGISGDSMTMTEAASTSATGGSAASSSLAIIIDGTTMYETGDISAGPGQTVDRTDDSTSTATADSGSTDSSTGWGSKVTQAPMIAGGVAALAFLAA